MRHGWLVASAPLVALACGACGAFFDLSKLGAEADVVDAGVDASDAEAGIDAPPDASHEEDSSAPCVDAGAPMKRIGVYCIDSTEATNAEYAAFLARTDGGTSAPVGPTCADDLDRVPKENWPADPFYAKFPVMGVTYCDAWSYCHAAGKRLCGRRGGGQLSSTDVGNAELSEWYRACSKAGTKIFPYGDQPVIGACAVDNKVRAVGQGCEGGYIGIFDMVGNVAEWIDVCDGEFQGTPLCVVQGGTPIDNLADCTTEQLVGRTAKFPFAGIRCCAD